MNQAPANSPRRQVAAELLLATVVFLVMSLFLIGPILFTGRILLLRDLLYMHYPGQALIAEFLSQGVLPLWTPYVGCGQPVLAEIETAVFYPPNLVALFLDPGRTTMVLGVFHFTLAGLGVYALLRTWSAGQTASLMSAIAFAFSSLLSCKLEWTAELASAAWFPCVLAAFANWNRSRRWKSFLLLAIAIAMQFLGGYPEIVFFTACTLVLYGLVQGALRRSEGAAWRVAAEPLAVVFAGGGVAMLLAMAQFWPTLEVLNLTSRTEMDPLMREGSASGGLLAALIMPSVYGTQGAPFSGRYFAPTLAEYWLGAIYVGLLPILVILTRGAMALIPGKARCEPDHARQSHLLFLVMLAVVSFLYAMGEHGFLFEWLWNHVTLMQQFRWPAKSLICFVLAVCLLAGLCLDDLQRMARTLSGEKLRRSRVHLPIVLLAVAAVLGVLSAICLADHGRLGLVALERFFNSSTIPSDLAHRIPLDIMARDLVKLPIVAVLGAGLLPSVVHGRPRPVAAAILFLLVAFCDLAISNRHLQIAGSPEVAFGEPAHLAKLQPPGKVQRFYVEDNTGQLYGETNEDVLRLARDVMMWRVPTDVHAFNAFPVEVFEVQDVVRITSMLYMRLSPEFRDRVFSMINCGVIVWYPRLRPAFAGGRLAEPRYEYPSRDPLPRVHVVGGVRVIDGIDEAVDILAEDPTFDPATEVLLDRDSFGETAVPALAPSAVENELRRIEYVPNGVQFEIESARPGICVLSDTWFPGWEATVNGEDVPIWKANGAFRAVRVPAGISRVEMRYNPPAVRHGIAISLATLVALALISVVVPVVRRCRSMRGSQPAL